MSKPKVKAAIFDLDGTLADTGPDLVAALNVLREKRGLHPVSMKEAGHVVGYGSRKLMKDFLADENEEIAPLRNSFLDAYEMLGHANTTLFEGIKELLSGLEEKKVPWSIVTNKPSRHTNSLLPVIGLDGRPAVVVCSDTLSRHKPHPDGLLHVCDKLGIGAKEAVFVGDNDLDVEAAESCGMPFVAAGWGYWPNGMPSEVVLEDPRDVLGMVGSS